MHNCLGIKHKNVLRVVKSFTFATQKEAKYILNYPDSPIGVSKYAAKCVLCRIRILYQSKYMGYFK